MPATPTAARLLDRAAQNLAVALVEGATPADVFAVALSVTRGGPRTAHVDDAHDLAAFAEVLR